MTEAESLEESAKHWDTLADEQDRWAAYYRERGEYDGVAKNKAESCRNAAKSLRLQAETGKPHCSCCLVPIENCRRKKVR